MLLTIRDVPEYLVRQAKIETGKGTGSQAFIAGIELMLKQRERIDEMQEEIRLLRETWESSRACWLMLMRPPSSWQRLPARRICSFQMIRSALGIVTASIFRPRAAAPGRELLAEIPAGRFQDLAFC